MVTREEGAGVRVRVMDFGLAHAATESRLTKTGTLVGTVAYLSPEQVASRAFDGRSDIYSLGVVLYECLVGEPPFTGEVQSILYRIVHEIPQPPREPRRRDPRGAPGHRAALPREGSAASGRRRPARSPRHCGATSSSLHERRVPDVGRPVREPRHPAPRGLPAFVGREKEFAELQRRLNAAIAGECQFAVVAGEPGIGKTRLLEELKNLATRPEDPRPLRALRRAGPLLLLPGLLRAHRGLLSVPRRRRAPSERARLLRPRRGPDRPLSRSFPRSRSCARRSAATRGSRPRPRKRRPRTGSRSSSSSRVR